MNVDLNASVSRKTTYVIQKLRASPTSRFCALGRFRADSIEYSDFDEAVEDMNELMSEQDHDNPR